MYNIKLCKYTFYIGIITQFILLVLPAEGAYT